MNRRSVRGLLLTDEPAILLMKFAVGGQDREIWITPGGGVDRGEEPAGALRRELFEETGLKDFEIGPLVWKRTHTFPFNGTRVTQSEEFFVVRTNRFLPQVNHLDEGDEKSGFRELAWWELDAIRQSSEVFVPRSLASHLEVLVTAGAPTEPIDVGI